MDKTLFEIEKEYTVEIIKFFKKEYCLHKRGRKKEDIISLMSGQLEKRLFKTGLINNYRVDVILYPKDERRDVIIDGLLEDKYVDVVSRVTVMIEYRDSSMMCYEHFID